jgi:homoserine kinase type II
MADYSEQKEVLAAWGCKPLLVERMSGGAANEHWRIETASGSFVLRRYNRRHLSEGIVYEQEVLRHLQAFGWPVAPPLRTGEGEDLVVSLTGRWSLFPFLEGSPAPPDEAVFLQRKGAVLALVQRDLATWDAPGQRPGFGRVVDLATALRPEEYDGLPPLLDWLAERDPSRAASLSGFRQRNLLALHHRGYDELPDVTGYFECLGNNVLFQGKDVSGLLDFDFVHRDARVADAARSLLVDCGPDPDRIGRWLAGYATFAEPALTVAEAEILPELMMANAIWNVAIPLGIASRGGSAWMMESALDALDTLLPRLEIAASGLRRVTRAAAGMATEETPREGSQGDHRE